MDKRELRKLPVPAVTKKLNDLGAILRQDHLKEYICQACLSGETLVLDIFDVRKEVRPVYRAFFEDDDYITLDLQSGKWKTGALSIILGYYYWNPGAVFNMASRKDIKIADNWLNGYLERHEIKKPESTLTRKLIDAYQDNIKHKRLKLKHKKERAALDHKMEIFGELPKDFKQWVDKKAMYEHNFLFFEKKKKYAYCTRCHNEFSIEHDAEDGAIILKMKKCGWVNNRTVLKHNSEAICPYCFSNDIGVKTVAKSMGYSRQALKEVQWAVLLDPAELDGQSVVILRYICCVKDYSKDIFNPEISIFERERVIHYENRMEEYEWGYDGRIDCNAWIKRRHNWMWNVSYCKAPLDGEIAYDISDEHFKGSWLQYSCIKKFTEMMVGRKGKTGMYFFDKYINFYRRNKCIEKLIKLGWADIVKKIADDEDHNVNKINQDGRTAADVLKITRSQFLMLAGLKKREWAHVEILQYCNENNLAINQDELYHLGFIRKHYRETYWGDDGSHWKDYLELRKYSTIHKLMKYRNALPPRATDRDYIDYINWTKEMGYDMKNSFNLYPKDFWKAHDERSKEYMEYRSEVAKKAMAEFNKLLEKNGAKSDGKFNLDAGGLFIRLPENIDEMKKEGEALHHCVGTYREKVMKGETTILFIRKVKEPKKSFYTLEWKDGVVIQCRGMKNCDMTPEVKKFVNLFKDKMAEYEKKFMKVRKAV